MQRFLTYSFAIVIALVVVGCGSGSKDMLRTQGGS